MKSGPIIITLKLELEITFLFLILIFIILIFSGCNKDENMEIPKCDQSLEIFNGLCFSPYRDSQNPNNNVHPSYDEIKADLEFTKCLTTKIRTYGVTGGLEEIPYICYDLNIDCYPGAWLSESNCDNEIQISNLIKIAKDNLQNVKGLIVGNEVMLRNDLTEEELINYINTVKSQTNLQIATAETWSHLIEHPNLVNAVDIILVHIYPYWDGISIDESINYILEKWSLLKSTYPKKEMIIGETGWPSEGSIRNNAVPSGINQREYIKNFISIANTNDIEYFYFEIFDEKWKKDEGDIGVHWGMYNSNGSMKTELSEILSEVTRYSIERPSVDIKVKEVNLPIYIYKDGCDTQNLFTPSGWMGEISEIAGDSSLYKTKEFLNVQCFDNPYSGESCIKINYSPLFNRWSGIYWQYPVNNWGEYPGLKIYHSNNVKLTFYARGEKGGEKAEFKSGGINDSNFKFSDSYGPKTTGIITLGKEWNKYTIDLSSENLSMVIGGFCWVSNWSMNPNGATIYIDEIQIVSN